MATMEKHSGGFVVNSRFMGLEPSLFPSVLPTLPFPGRSQDVPRGPDPSISGVQAHTTFYLEATKESVGVPTDLTDIHTGTLIPFVLS